MSWWFKCLFTVTSKVGVMVQHDTNPLRKNQTTYLLNGYWIFALIPFFWNSGRYSWKVILSHLRYSWPTLTEGSRS